MGKYFAGEMKHKNNKIIICKYSLHTDLLCDMYIIFYTVFILNLEFVSKKNTLALE